MFGWLSLRREAAHSRPLVLAATAAVGAWHRRRGGGAVLVGSRSSWASSAASCRACWPSRRESLQLQYVSHVLLLCLMLAASFIDIDEKIIPDEITVPGTILGLALATMLPMSLLPHVAQRARAARGRRGNRQGAMDGAWYLEPVTAVAPHAWPPRWGVAGTLAVARDRARLLLAVVLRAHAADLARPARLGVRIAR